MKRHNSKLRICVLVCLIVLAIVSTSVQIFATSLNSHTERILFITDDTECNRMKSVEAFHSNDVIADVLTREAVDADMLSSYGAVILPYGEENNTVARAAYENGSVVYLYGELTIKDYKDSVGVDEYALTMPIYKESGTREEIVQFFDTDYEENEIFNVISYSQHALLCKISQELPENLATYEQQNVDENSDENIYLTAAEKNFLALKRRTTARAVVDSDFDITSYFGPNNEYSVHMDYTLYQNDSDRDPDYDYFGIKTKIWVDNSSGDVSRLRTKYVLPYPSDNLLETGPASKSNAGQISISIGYGENGPSGSISYSMDLSDSSPNISRDEDYTNDVVEWSVTPRSLLPKHLNNQNFSSCATWASKGGSLAAIDVSYAGRVNVGPDGVHGLDSGYNEVPIRFYY